MIKPKDLSGVRLKKVATGIKGLDEITYGGLPQGRPTLVCGGPGCGKTMMATEFLVRGALEYNEPGVFMAFEETPLELTQNVASLGFDLRDLVARKKLSLDYVHVDRSEIQETGEYDLEGLFIRLDLAIRTVKAKRVVLDTIESLFSGFNNPAILRAEIRRLFRWLKDRGMTTVITAERGEGTLTRQGLEEYVSDCVILLDHRVIDQLSTRRVRVVKYRGTQHGTNEYPFLIDQDGMSVLPITSLGLDHKASRERVSSGIPDLDEMLEGKGYYRGSTVLVSGTAGSGKTSIASHLAIETCRRGERALYVAFEESRDQVIRNMRSIGLDLEAPMKKGLLRFEASRPAESGLEMHLVRIHKLVEQFKPTLVIIDPITNLIAANHSREVEAMLTRLIDFLKQRQITALFVSLTTAGSYAEQTEVGISSLIDTWLLLREMEVNGERNRGLYVVKSRGMAHSNQVREFVLTNRGVKLVDVYLGASGVLTGSARTAQEQRELEEDVLRQQELDRQKLVVKSKRQAMEGQIAALRAQFEADQKEAERIMVLDQLRQERGLKERKAMAFSRKARQK
ncbi:MAG TPA: circadian clock protein KaiC [Terriglobales bacterium]|nr:circadian clock protein KaiC [Terriglobales bacterium]